MDASRFIASKLKFKSRLAIGATAVSAFIIVLSISILSGFKTEIYKGISKICAEVCLYAPDANTFDEDIIATLEKDKRIESVRAAVVEPSILKNGESLEGVIFHSDESISEKLHVKITKSLARTLSAHKNDTLTAYFIGDKMKVRNFVVEEIIEDPALIDKNAQIAFAGISDLQRVKGLRTGEADCLEVRLLPALKDRRSIDAIAPELAYETGYRAISSTARFPAIYDWLEILDANVILILILMCIVAGFNMVSGFLILIMRSTSTIVTLSALGMNSKQIGKTFLRLACGSTLKGLLIGNAAALLFCIIQACTHFLKLDPQNYFVSYLPIHLDAVQIILANLLAFAAVILLVAIPTRRISRIDSKYL